MKWIKVGALSFLAGIVFIGVVYFLIGYFRPKPGGILVNTTPLTNVFVNGNSVGITPYEGTFEAGSIDLKLVPQELGNNYLPYETKVGLVSGVKTIVRREFSESDETSSGDIVSFEKEGGKEAGIVVISEPDNAQVLIDGTPRGFAPYKGSNVAVGEHAIGIKSSGYSDRTLNVQTIAGYKLTIIAKLARLAEEPKVEAAKTETKTFIKIADTPTGFLRVRSEPGSVGREIHQVNPGDKFPFLEEDAATGWFKIQIQAPAPGLPDGVVGWVSNEYSSLLQIPVMETPE